MCDSVCLLFFFFFFITTLLPTEHMVHIYTLGLR